MFDNLLETGMKQGSVVRCSNLSDELRNKLQSNRSSSKSRNKPVDKQYNLLILSQDCDISNSNLKTLEVLVMKKAPEGDKKRKEFRKGRTFQKLILPFEGEEWLLQADWISCIDKCDLLAEINNPVSDKFSDKNANITLRWLTDKYIRRPFPDGFNKIILPRIWNTDLSIFLEKNHELILEVYAYVSPEDEVADLYDVAIVLLLSNDCDEEQAIEIADVIKYHCTELHKEPTLNMLQVEGTAGQILDGVDYAQLPEDFVKIDELMMKPLSLNYLCWPDEPSVVD